MGKFKLPSQDDDWSGVYQVIQNTIEEFSEKKVGKWVKRDRDTSELPDDLSGYDDETGEFNPPKNWNEDTPFKEWLKSGCTGNTIATYQSQSGLVAEKIGDVFHDRIHEAITRMFIKINKNLTQEEINLDEYCGEIDQIVLDMTDDLKNMTLSEVKEEVKEYVEPTKEG